MTVTRAGQYDGEAKPLPEYHTKIAGFEEKVSELVIKSGCFTKSRRQTEGCPRNF